MPTVADVLLGLREWSAENPTVALRVFGSVMRSNPEAHDVDLGVDIDTPPWTNASGHCDLPKLKSCAGLLGLRRDMGLAIDGKPLLDVFVHSGGKLFVPTDDCHWWKPAPDPTVWLKIQSRGIPLSSVIWARSL